MEGAPSLPPFTLSDEEATFYYFGLPSSPRLLARTSTTPWKKTQSLDAYIKPKQLGVVFNHKLNTIWRDVAPKVAACLDEMGVRWSTIDVFRIGLVGEPAPVILWIGAEPQPLAGEKANTAAFRCLDILKEFGVTDVHVEIRESSFVCSAGPTLFPPVVSTLPTATARHPLTHALSLHISPEAMPDTEGTGGFFLTESRESNKLLLVTARHVVLPPTKVDNVEIKCDSNNQPRHDVLLLGKEPYKSCLASINVEIGQHQTLIASWNQRLKDVEGKDHRGAHAERKAAPHAIAAAEEAITELTTFYADVAEHWATPANRVLGHVTFSPPIRFGVGTRDQQYTEDYAIIEVDKDKIDKTEFEANVIDLGSKIRLEVFTEMMNPNPDNTTYFEYPSDRLLRLKDTIPDSQMRRPTFLDKNGDPCLIVIKDGAKTGVTIGHANGIESLTRKDFHGGVGGDSWEWAIVAYSTKFTEPFSAPGDSGAVVVDGIGRIGGLITGGGRGVKDSLDVTYATPINFLLERIKANGYPDAHLPTSSPQAN